MKRYAELMAINKNARQSVEGGELEQAYYDQIRQNYGITGATPEEESEISGKKRPRADQAPVEKVEGLMWNSDDDE